MIKFDLLANGLGLPYDRKNQMICGNYQGYTILIQNLQKQKLCHVTMSVAASDESRGDVLTQPLQQYAAQKPEIQFASYTDRVVAVGIRNKRKISAEEAGRIIDEIVALFRTVGAVNCCQSCGSREDVGAYTVLGHFAILCPSCFEKAKAELSLAQNDLHRKSTNYAGGIVGAVLGSLAGALIWVLASQFGYIVGVSGLAFVIGGLYGFKKLGGKLNVAGFIISVVIAAAMLYFAENVSLTILIFNEFKDTYEISFFDAFRIIPEVLKDHDVFNGFVYDLAIGYLFLVIGGFSSAVSMFKEANLKYKMERLDRAAPEKISD